MPFLFSYAFIISSLTTKVSKNLSFCFKFNSFLTDPTYSSCTAIKYVFASIVVSADDNAIVILPTTGSSTVIDFALSATTFTGAGLAAAVQAGMRANGMFTGQTVIYNTTTDGGSGTTDAVCILAFGSDFTATNGTFTVQFPAPGVSTAILRLA